MSNSMLSCWPAVAAGGMSAFHSWSIPAVTSHTAISAPFALTTTCCDGAGNPRARTVSSSGFSNSFNPIRSVALAPSLQTPQGSGWDQPGPRNCVPSPPLLAVRNSWPKDTGGSCGIGRSSRTFNASEARHHRADRPTVLGPVLHRRDRKDRNLGLKILRRARHQRVHAVADRDGRNFGLKNPGARPARAPGGCRPDRK